MEKAQRYEYGLFTENDGSGSFDVLEKRPAWNGEAVMFEEHAAIVVELMGLLRREWWQSHGCRTIGMYGDDGEMQCGFCVTDFKRMPFDALQERVGYLRLKGLYGAKPLNSTDTALEPYK